MLERINLFTFKFDDHSMQLLVNYQFKGAWSRLNSNYLYYYYYYYHYHYYYYYSFITLNLSAAFFKDDQMELYKALGYDRLEYLIVHPCLIFSIWFKRITFRSVRVKWVWVLTLNPLGKKS